MFFLLLLFVSLAAAQTPNTTVCLFDIFYNAPNAPIFLNSKFEYPTPISIHSTQVSFKQGEFFYIGCPNGTASYPIASSGELAICHHDAMISSLTSDQIIDLNQLKCFQDSRPAVTHVQSTNCYYNYGTYHLLTTKVFGADIISIEVCFSKNLYSPVFLKYVTNQWLDKNPNYNTTNLTFYNSDLAFDNYLVEDIVANAKNLFKKNGLGKYITENVTLVVGQLAHPSEFLTSFEKDTTFDTANTVPRWNTVDQGNWKNVRDSIDFLITHGGDYGNVSMRAGGLGVASLVNENSETVNLYLGDGKTFPVPEWNWKIMFSKSTNVGVVFFVYNNPYIEKSQVDDIFNTTICRQNVFDNLNWVDKIDNKDPFAGYTYACSLDKQYVINDLINFVIRYELP